MPINNAFIIVLLLFAEYDLMIQANLATSTKEWTTIARKRQEVVMSIGKLMGSFK